MDKEQANQIIIERGYEIGNDRRSVVAIASGIVVREAMSAPNNEEAVEDPAHFSRVVDAALEISVLTETDLCELFAVSRTTVQRWREGIAAPAPVIRKHVMEHAMSEFVKLDESLV